MALNHPDNIAVLSTQVRRTHGDLGAYYKVNGQPLAARWWRQ
jgi:hypothetical protein